MENNLVPTTRLPKKRPLEKNPNLETTKNPKLQNVSKKRVPLGDLTNRVLVDKKNPNLEIEKNPNKNPSLEIKKDDKLEVKKLEIIGSFEDQNVIDYGSDIYKHLRSLEVPLGDLTNQSPDLDSNLETKKDDKLDLKKIDKAVVKKSEIIGSFEDQNVIDYGSDIYKHLRALEVEEKRRPLADYMEKVQKDVNVAMREILLDWLVEVAEEYKLVPDTLHLTISFIDKFLSQNSISRNKLQLLGVSSMLVASKYEEIKPPHVEDFCYITDYTYSREEVVNMEIDVLKCVDFKLGTPTIKTFLRIFTRVAQETPELCDMKMEFLGYYLAELSLLDYGCLRFLPSMIAASAIFLSRFIIQPKMHPWSLALERCSGYRPSELKECVLAIHALPLSRRAKSFQAVRGKYTQHKFKCVATLPCPSEIPASYFEGIDE